jgi:FtsP/CotA-like multicopper oxidase with cupredoxin domain
MNPKISIFLKRLAMALSGVVLIGVAEAAEYTLIAEEIDWEPRPGLKLKGWALGLQRPDPVPEIRVKEGERVTIHFTNRYATGLVRSASACAGSRQREYRIDEGLA